MRKSRSHIRIISSSNGTDIEKYWPLEIKKKILSTLMTRPLVLTTHSIPIGHRNGSYVLA